MTTTREGRLLRIYLGESDHHEGTALHEWIVRAARERGLAGATVLRGLMGYGAHSTLHTAKILSVSCDLPVVIEIIDAPAKIDAFLEALGDVLNDVLATVETVQIHEGARAREDD